MAFSTSVKSVLNRVLRGANIQIETLTAVRREQARIEELEVNGQFERAVFPIPESFTKTNASEILSALPQFRARLDSFRDDSINDVGFSFANDYFHSPDAEVLYTLIRIREPGRIIEIGSGNSTKVARQAIIDGKLKTHLLSIDPEPRTEIDSFADECLRQRVEEVNPALFETLRAGDFLFIDSSHEIKPGNDVVFLFLSILPKLAPGVMVHIHDIFLPFDYPIEWVRTTAWSEQYLVQALLSSSADWNVLWAAFYLFKSQPELARHFPNWRKGDACSLWLRRKEAPPGLV